MKMWEDLSIIFNRPVGEMPELLEKASAMGYLVVPSDRIEKLLDLTTDHTFCSSCKKKIWFLKMKKTGKMNPMTSEGVSHYADCPNAKTHRDAKIEGI
jgi:hypothetical protein